MFITRAIAGSNVNIRNTFTAARQAAINAGFSGIYQDEGTRGSKGFGGRNWKNFAR